MRVARIVAGANDLFRDSVRAHLLFYNGPGCEKIHRSIGKFPSLGTPRGPLENLYRPPLNWWTKFRNHNLLKNLIPNQWYNLTRDCGAFPKRSPPTANIGFPHPT